MQFDVIIGNPPYQLKDGGHGASASPIYHKFVEQAKALEPRFLSMVVPSRWFGGGIGLANFRASMLADNRLRKLIDFENARDVFPGVGISGGVCYFLWDRDHVGLCEVVNITGTGPQTPTERRLDEFPTFVRHGDALPIIRKVLSKAERRMSEQVSSLSPFGLPTNARPEATGDLVLRWRKGEGPFSRSNVAVGEAIIDKWKVITCRAASDSGGSPGKDGRRKVFSKIDVMPPKTICTGTYLVIGAYESKIEAENLVNYMKTIFFRFLVSQLMYSHNLAKSAYGFVPLLTMTTEWSDEKLRELFKLSDDEAQFMADKIRPFVKC